MKRFLLLVLSFLVIITIVGFLLPSNNTYTIKINSPIPFDGISRVIVNKGDWKRWWPGEIVNDSTITYKDAKFNIKTILLNGFELTGSLDNRSINFSFQSSATYNAETAITMTATVSLSRNPFIKVFQNIVSGGAVKTLNELFNNIGTALSDVKKVYGFDIKLGKVPNSSYVSTSKYFDHQPGMEEVYSLIKEVEDYVVAENGKIVNDPILNISKESENKYMAMVALATDRDLPTKGKFLLKQMMLGNIVVSQVKGGPSAIQQCRQAVQFYVNDYRKVSPAISFERLLTNRLTEKDSTKWLTTINYPVFQ